MPKSKQPRGPKVKGIGPSLGWTEFDLERLASVTEEDKAAARAFWRRQAPRPVKRLVDARKKP